MSHRVSDRMLWIAVGAAAALSISYFWPHEPAHAISNDRNSKFAIATCPITFTDNHHGVFVLDFLTGQLKGAVLNPSAKKFFHGYGRNLAADFNVDPKAEPHYAFVAGKAPLTSRGRVSTAQGVIYVAELTSGKVIAYGFPYNQVRGPVRKPLPLVVLDYFQFREATAKE